MYAHGLKCKSIRCGAEGGRRYLQTKSPASTHCGAATPLVIRVHVFVIARPPSRPASDRTRGSGHVTRVHAAHTQTCRRFETLNFAWELDASDRADPARPGAAAAAAIDLPGAADGGFGHGFGEAGGGE